MSKDSLIRLLGKPDEVSTEDGMLYYYEKHPFMGGLGSTVDALAFVLNTDNTVKTVKLHDQLNFFNGASWD
jgi:hypothetical protein